jgi:hypothetical protein
MELKRGGKMPLERIIVHWTAGSNSPNETEKEHYHFMIDGTGNIHNGIYTPEDNLNCKDGKYAQHTGGGNTGSIGIGLCGMLGFKDKNHVGDYPLTKTQCETAFKFVAGLCKKYKIAVTPETIMTHKEFGDSHPKTTSYGKIDIYYLPPYPEIPTNEIGDFIRGKVQWYLNHM